jgi:glycosyltransferase involved in cell wall biosynthesis
MKILCAYKPHSDQFAYPYVRALGATTLRRTSYAEVYDQAARHDAVWIEWANDFAAALLKRRLGAFTVVRIHDHEIRQGRVDRINFENVDLLWFINRDAMRDFAKRLPGVLTPRFFLPNAVDVSQFEYVAEDSNRLAFLSLLPRPRKRLDRAIRLLTLLPDHTLHIRTSLTLSGYGCNPREEVRKMMFLAKSLEVGKRLFWEFSEPDHSKLKDKTEVVEFFRGKSHVVSTSEHEGFHYSVAEGALCGLAPVVYDWEWGRAGDFWNVCPSIEHMANAVLMLRPSTEHRRDVAARFGADVLAKELTQILESHLVAA